MSLCSLRNKSIFQFSNLKTMKKKKKKKNWVYETTIQVLRRKWVYETTGKE